jgi:hypothetical protein
MACWRKRAEATSREVDKVDIVTMTILVELLKQTIGLRAICEIDTATNHVRDHGIPDAGKEPPICWHAAEAVGQRGLTPPGRKTKKGPDDCSAGPWKVLGEDA